MSEATERLREIMGELKELTREATEIIRYEGPPGTHLQATSYPIPHILGAIDKDNDYIGASPMYTLDDIVKTMEDEEAPESMGPCGP